MLSEIPISAYTLCYGPLALTIIGFILFAALTDVDARRTYMRIRDLRPEGAQTGGSHPVITQPINSETPSGVRVSVRPNPNAEPVAVAEPASVETVEENDDLTTIEGIGPQIAQALIAAGLTSFASIAAASTDDFTAALEAAGLRFAPSMESWAEQAALAAAGDWEALDALQDRLESGRYPSNDS